MTISNNTKLKICGIEPESIVDGPGFRYVVFVQGCPHHCHGCHNPESWSFGDGATMTVGEIFNEICNSEVSGVTFSGGEPFCQAEALAELGKLVKSKNLSLMCYTGYTLEELQEKQDSAVDELLSLTDILVDGRYVEEERDLTLLYKGSRNQRVIDMGQLPTT